MRVLSMVLVILSCLPAAADEIAATSRVTAVTLYPYGASLSREISFTAPAGAHQLVLTDLPGETRAEAIRVQGSGTVRAGAVWLRGDRLFPRPEVPSEEQQAARAVIDAAQGAVDGAADALAGVQARIEAANAEIGFLSATRAEGEGLTPEALRALSAALAEGVAAARTRAIAAGAEARPLQKALEEALVALDLAQQAYDALPAPDEDYAALSVAVEVTSAGAHRLVMTQIIDNAGWAPVYDLTLRRGASPSLTLARGALVTQFTGEDWQGVALTLSTARPSEQAAAGTLYPDYREIYDPEAERSALAKAGAEMMTADAVMVEEAAPMAPGAAEVQGDVLIYRYEGAADIASGAENLRLSLDEIVLDPRIYALAVPRLDRTAFVTAEVTNTSGEVLLPGAMTLFRDDNLVGAGQMPLLAAGDDWTVGFGAIDGLVLERLMPEVQEGDRGLLSSATERTEAASLIARNLTAEAWAVRLLDQVPYSEQEDLQISYEASPEPTEADVKGERGILAWEFELAPGAEQRIEIEHRLRWPSGMALR